MSVGTEKKPKLREEELYKKSNRENECRSIYSSDRYGRITRYKRI